MRQIGYIKKYGGTLLSNLYLNWIDVHFAFIFELLVIFLQLIIGHSWKKNPGFVPKYKFIGEYLIQ